MATAPILAPDGSIRMIPQNQVEQALSAGGKQVTKMQAPDKALRWVANDQVDAATKAGGLVIPGMSKSLPAGLTDAPGFTGEGTEAAGPHRVIVPKEGESFADTMKRSAAAGSTVTPEQLAVSEREATDPKNIGTVLGSAAAIGVGGPAVLAGSGRVAQALVGPGAKQLVQKGAGFLLHEAEEQAPSLARQGLTKAAEWAAAHPQIVAKGAEAAGLAALYKLYKAYGK